MYKKPQRKTTGKNAGFLILNHRGYSMIKLIPVHDEDNPMLLNQVIICINNKHDLIMDQNSKISSRKKFLLWSAAVISSLTVFKLIPGSDSPKKETVKMLTQDGRLVEVEISKTKEVKKEKINDEQLKNWVTKK